MSAAEVSERDVRRQREAELWQRWREGRDDAVRHALVELHLYWVRLIAREVQAEMRVTNAEWSDYLHYGTVGLLESIERFDPDYGVEFQTYARKRVRGAIFNGIGDFVSTSRSGGAEDLRLQERARSLLEEGSDDPLQEIIALSVGLAIGHLLDHEAESRDGGHGDSTYAAVERSDMEAIVAAAIEELPERERSVMRLHYFQQISFTDVAALLGVTKGRVSQLHSQAVKRIKGRFDELRERDVTV